MPRRRLTDEEVIAKFGLEDLIPPEDFPEALLPVPDPETPQSGAWNREKVDMFSDLFYEFLHHVQISSKETGSTVLGDNLYGAQIRFLDSVWEALSNDIHDIYVLKSRQLGLSTIVRPLSLFWAGMHSGLRGSVIFDSAENIAAARSEIEEALESLPAKLKFPRIKGRNRSVLMLDNDSWLFFRNAGTRKSKVTGGLGRSLGLNFSHASEICSWADQSGITSYRQSLAEFYENRLYIWESTARGPNAWKTLWDDATDDDHCATVFIGWWAKETQVIRRGTADWESYGLEPPNRRERERIDTVRKLYGVEITPEQLAWYRRKTDPNRELDEEDAEDSDLIQEQAWHEVEAWQLTGSTFFQGDKLADAAVKITAGPKPQAFKFWAGMDFLDCDMKPARFKNQAEFLMWEEPQPGNTYVVSGDPAFGHDEENDHSSAQVLRCFADGIDQVGEYESGSIQPHQFAWLLWTLVGYYGSRPQNSVMMILEINGPGEEVWRQYESVRYRLHTGAMRGPARERGIADITANARNYVYQRSDSFQSGHSQQFKTAAQNKVQLMEAGRNYFHNGILRVQSLRVLDQMRIVTRDGDEIGAEGRHRDDNVFSLCLGVRAWDEKLRRGLIAGNRTREAERAKVSLSLQDQWNLFQRNNLADFFKQKQVVRQQSQWISDRASWRAGGRRYTPQRWH